MLHFILFNAKNSGSNQVFNTYLSKKLILKESTYLIHTLLKPLLFHVIFTAIPREVYSDGVKIIVSTVIQLGFSPCSIAYQLWAQGQPSSVFIRSLLLHLKEIKGNIND